MSTRTFQELKDAVDKANSINDAVSLMKCADELDALATPEAEAAAHSARGVGFALGSNYPVALEHYHRALGKFEELGNGSGVAGVTGNIGLVHMNTGNYPAALDHLHHALTLHEELGERRHVARVTGNIGNVYGNTGNYPAALEHYQRSLDVLEELGIRSGVAGVTGNIGIAHENTGNYPAALEHYHRALAIYEELEDRSGVARVIVGIGNVHFRTGNYPSTLEHYHRALAIDKEQGDRSGVAASTGNIGNVHSSTGNYPAALEHFHRAFALHEELGDRSGVARVTSNIGVVHFHTDNYPEALEHYHRALAIHQELGESSGVAAVTINIGSVHQRAGNYPAALEHFHRALALHEELGSRSGVALVTCNIITAMIEIGEHAKADALLQTMDVLQIDDPDILVQKEKNRASLQEHHGRIGETAATLRAALLIAQEHTLAPMQADLHKALRDLALKQSDLAGYVEHNNEYSRITEEINGKEATLKMAMQEKQREIDAKDREHQKHMAVLHSTLPKDIADRVARGETVNDHHENAAVIFLDIVGFTQLSASMSSQDVIELLDDVFSQCDAICKQHNVTKIKTIGDSYMCVAFDSVINAAHVAMEMMNITLNEALNEALAKALVKEKALIKFRIGIHCGPVTAGVLGKERMQYDVWGDTVNVASRMESTSEPGRIHISEALNEALNKALENALNEAHIVPRGTMDIKGKGMMKTYWLESL
ncbi:MAG: tetratricopeptide repeat protein [Ignavibacteria bacterium]|nr:tetratricopeptide repeat protein [Ignavibacteria bacterium]